tara:strand:- start:74 stop:337 length:264 start_codon:yes stop_codon:yes gene_type:complete
LDRLLGILITMFLVSCSPEKMLKGLQAAGAKLGYWGFSFHIRMLWGPLSGWGGAAAATNPTLTLALALTLALTFTLTRTRTRLRLRA